MKKRVLILVIILVLAVIISLVIYNYQRNIKLEQSYESKGWKLYKQGKYDEAIAEFKKNLIDKQKNWGGGLSKRDVVA